MNPFPVSTETQLRVAALSLRSLCDANGWTSLRAEHPDGYALIYRASHGLELVDSDERLAFYPEAELDDERWAPAKWTAPEVIDA